MYPSTQVRPLARASWPQSSVTARSSGIISSRCCSASYFRASNITIDLMPASRCSAGTGHRERSPHRRSLLMRGGSNGPGVVKKSSNRRRREEAHRPIRDTGRRPRRRSIVAARSDSALSGGGAVVWADAMRRRQADRQRGVHSHGGETSGHRGASRVGQPVSSEQLRGVEPASRAGAGNGRRRCEARRPRRSPPRWADERRRNAPMTTRKSLRRDGSPSAAGRL